MLCRDCTRRSHTQQRLEVICSSHADTQTLLELIASTQSHQRPQSFLKIFICSGYVSCTINRKLIQNTSPNNHFVSQGRLILVFQITEAEADEQPSHAVPLSKARSNFYLPTVAASMRPIYMSSLPRGSQLNLETLPPQHPLYFVLAYSPS